MDQAVIDPEKVRDYLLSPTHPVGRFKAAYFAQVGYAQDDWAQLAADLRAVASCGTAKTSPDS